MDHVNNTFWYVEDKLLVRWGRFFYIVLHVLRYSEDTWRGTYNRIIGQWYVVHGLQMSELDRSKKGDILRENYRGEWSRFQDDKFVPTFHWIFGLRDANPLELLFHAFVSPMIRGVERGENFNWYNGSDFSRTIFYTPSRYTIGRTWVFNIDTTVVYGDDWFPA